MSRSADGSEKFALGSPFVGAGLAPPASANRATRIPAVEAQRVQQEIEMQGAARRRLLSIDAWAALIAFTLAALIRAGFLKHIPW